MLYYDSPSNLTQGLSPYFAVQAIFWSLFTWRWPDAGCNSPRALAFSWDSVAQQALHAGWGSLPLVQLLCWLGSVSYCSPSLRTAWRLRDSCFAWKWERETHPHREWVEAELESEANPGLWMLLLEFPALLTCSGRAGSVTRLTAVFSSWSVRLPQWLWGVWRRNRAGKT